MNEDLLKGSMSFSDIWRSVHADTRLKAGLKLRNQLFRKVAKRRQHIKHHTFFGGVSNSHGNVPVHVLPSAGLSPRAAEIIERVGLLWTERR